MIFFQWYRAYISLLSGILFYLFITPSIWIAATVSVAARTIWSMTEGMVNRRRTNRIFEEHQYDFKQFCGPYGIRIANKAENDAAIKKSLCEIFVNDPQVLKKNVEQLEIIDSLFKAGLSPQGDEFLLHDLKLKYGKRRLETMAGLEKK